RKRGSSCEGAAAEEGWIPPFFLRIRGARAARLDPRKTKRCPERITRTSTTGSSLPGQTSSLPQRSAQARRVACGCASACAWSVRGGAWDVEREAVIFTTERTESTEIARFVSAVRNRLGKQEGGQEKGK